VRPEDGGWETVGASPTGFDDLPAPHELTVDEIAAITRAFGEAAARAVAQGFRVLEVHGAHGYLAHQFLSPLTNTRTDAYGSDRTRFLREVVQEVRRAVPDSVPLLVRVSATDWAEGGWDVADTVELCRELKELGVDLVDVSSGGNVPQQRITVGPGYQVPFARAVREGAGVPTGAVGLITEPAQADEVVSGGDADLVLLARALLRDPHWALRAAHELGAEVTWPDQYLRARFR
jgi:2,4-dienoyl-CoA reductase-like NADH-dependent reductase (Old Yellow Enzyme family)